MLTRFLSTMLVVLAAVNVFAAEQSGIVRSGELPIPGATVKASKGERVVIVYTDESGRYSIPNLRDGLWRFEVEMFGFRSTSGIVRVPEETAVEWKLEVAGSGVEAASDSSGAGTLQLNRTESYSQIMGSPSSELGDAAALAALRQDASESYLVNGSLSSGVGMQQQIGAMFGLRGMRPGAGPGDFAGGGLTGTPSIFGGQQTPGASAGRPTGPLGRSGGPGAMRGGRGIGGRPGGARPPRGPGGAVSRESARGGGEGRPPEWLRRRGVAAFGNRRGGGRATVRGRAFFSINNSAFDARPYSISGQNITKASYAKYRFGVGLGGQLKIPKLIESSRTFFFLNYSGRRNKNPYDRIGSVPTEAERAGDFLGSGAHGPVTIYDPETRLPFPGNAVPLSQIDPASVGLLEFVPLPNLSGAGVQNFQFVTSVPQETDNFGLRMNHSLSSGNSLAGSFNIQRRHSEQAQLYGYRDNTDGRGISSSLGWTRTLTATLINTLTVKYSFNRTNTLSEFAYGPDVAGELGIQGTAPGEVNHGPPNLSFTNFGALTGASPSLRRDQAAGISEGVIWVRGKHTLRSGFEYRRNQVNNLTEANGRGSYSFSGLVTSRFDSLGNPAPQTGFDLADFLLGFPQSSSIRWGNPDMYFRAANYIAYAQDDWRVNSGLTINFGLRYEYSEPLREKYGRMANLDTAPGFTGASVVTPDVPGPYTGAFPRGLVDPDKNNFSPRVGIAWRPWAKRSTLIRAGFGIYYNGSIYDTIASRLGQQPPFANTNTFTTSVSFPLTITEGFLGVPGTDITNTFAVDRGYMVGYAQTWNLKIQHDLPWSMVLELGYLGTKGTRLDVQRAPNQAPPGSPVDSENRRPIPGAVSFTWDSGDGNSIYHAAQVRLMRRFRGGLSFQSLYTFSRSIDNVSSYGGGQAVVAQDPFNLRAERGLSSFDQRHVLDLSFFWTSPVGNGPAAIAMRGWGEKLLKDWTLGGGVNVNSGTPLTATVLGNRADSGGTGVVGNGRADATGQPVDAGDGFFNPLAFALPPPERYGNAGRNTIPGPGSFVLNLSLGRSFSVGGERRRLEFRINATNLLNTVNYTRFSTTVNASNYALPTSAATMRTITAQVSFRF